MSGPADGLPEGSGDLQTVVAEEERGRVVAIDSAYHVDDRNTGRDVVISASYSGVLPARFVADLRPRAAIGLDCGIGPDGAGIAGLWFYEALGIPAATADVAGILLGDGVDVHRNGVLSRVNAPALACGVHPGMPVAEAAVRLLRTDPVTHAPQEITNREVMEEGPDGRAVVCTDSIAFGTPADTGRSVLVTAGHTGRSAVPYLRSVRPWGFICSDGGRGREDSGMAGLVLVEPDGLAGATVDARTARMGDGLSTYHDGVISAANVHARACGVEVGMPAAAAAHLLLVR
ncbi:hypothetical protein [Pseudonocardia parietis]|uniref:Uncharacterized protein n=1 Tax=Pseudonocardia parietis TaxID=570936 RepID=A0ABS4VQK7_9PSEU|nr:hypothetical protein [Pseudonocardia parietis]MBP2366200.1 hypothetical protein [Pseudonocardia parietis]